MATIDWKNGRLISLNPGDTARCDGGLDEGQLYGVFFYNSAGNDTEATVAVTTTQGSAPVRIKVAGTTANQGPAALCFVSGDQTNTVSIAMTSESSSPHVQAFIGSVRMPVDTNGINNKSIELNGQKHAFEKFTRFYSVPPSSWGSGFIQSNITQFISVQFKARTAQVIILNSTVEPDVVVKYASPEVRDQVKITPVANQTHRWDFQGNGGQMVWINADSPQNSQSAVIQLQSLTMASQTPE